MRRKAWFLIAAAAVAGGAWALDPPRPAPAPAPSTQPAADKEQSVPAPDPAVTAAPAQEPAGPAVEDETLPPLPPESRRTGPTPQRFDPTEEVRADFPVSFPADI